MNHGLFVLQSTDSELSQAEHALGQYRPISYCGLYSFHDSGISLLPSLAA